MQVNQWYSIPNDATEHYEYWNGAQAFEPQKFSGNTKKETKWNDKGWAIAFYIQLAVSLILTIFLLIKATSKGKSSNARGLLAESSTATANQIVMYSVGTGIGIGVVINILHFVYAIFGAKIYIHLGLWLPFIICLIICVLIAYFIKLWAILVVPALVGLITVICYCCLRKYIPFSAAVFRKTMKLILKYPSLIFFTFLQMVVSIILNIIFSIMIYCTSYLGYTAFLYIWAVFSFFWTNLTYYYVTYMTGAGLAASYYFLNDTEYFPKNPVLQSYKRAMTTSFGSASVAGFLLAVIKTLRWLVDSISTNNIIIFFIILIIQCILCILEWVFSFLNHYGLIYCATFGVKYSEGCRRWLELSSKRFANVICSGCIINISVTYNWFVFSISSGILGALIGYYVIGSKYNSDDQYSFMVFCAIFTCLFACFIFNVLGAPIEVISDTLLVCFAEHPERMKTTANDLYQELVDLYGSELAHKIEKQNKKKK